jgi:hypothetical protein
MTTRMTTAATKIISIDFIDVITVTADPTIATTTGSA